MSEQEKAAYWAGRQKKTLVRTTMLFGKHYYWAEDLQLDQCSPQAHCFVSNRHTGETGCHGRSRLSLKPARWTR